MEFEQQLLCDVRAALARTKDVAEIRMFGGIGFMLAGNLVIAASRRGLLARIGEAQEREALGRAGARPMVMRGRAMRGYVYVDPPALDAASVAAWVKTAVAFVRTLPAKAVKPARSGAQRSRPRRSD
jgi:hypothetical protein